MFCSLPLPLRRPTVWAAACISFLATHAFAASAAINFGDVAVGATSTRQAVEVDFSRQGRIADINAVLLGAEGLDFSSTGGTCQVGSVYQEGQSCTVDVSFKPLLPGARNGAIVITNPAGATIATTYLTGVGQGPLATFPGAAPLLLTNDIGRSGYAVDGRGNAYFQDMANPTIVYQLRPGGARYVYATLPSEYDGAMIGAVDGAGNLILTTPVERGNKIRSQVLKIDASGRVRRIATIRPQPPKRRPVQLGGVAVLGNGDLLIGSTSPPGEEVFLFEVHPDGTYDARFGLEEPFAFSFVSDVAVSSNGTIYQGSYGWVYQNSADLFKNAFVDGLAVDASGTLLTGSEQGYLGNPQPCPTPTIPGGCSAVPAPPVNQLPFKYPIVDAHGDAYVVDFVDPASPLYKLNRTQAHGVVFASPGTGTGYGSFAITNSGNKPLDLSNLDPKLGGANPTAFNIERNGCADTLAPAATCTIALSYTPAGQFPNLPTSAALWLNGLGSTRTVVPLEGIPNQ